MTTRLEDLDGVTRVRLGVAIQYLVSETRHLDAWLLPTEQRRRLGLLVSECAFSAAEYATVAEYLHRRLVPE